MRSAIGSRRGGEVKLSGMITSRNGWVETPYCELPATLASLAACAVRREAANGVRLTFLPGICARHPAPDVMRGEEIQVFGSVAPEESAVVVLPGTHSKWVSVRHGAMTGFRTFMTGEFFALLRRHSIVGRLIPPGEPAFDEESFRAGVKQAQDAASLGLLNDAFTARSGALLGAFGPEAIADRLSGLLIGHELRAALPLVARGEAIHLVAESELAARYRLAGNMFGLDFRPGPPDATVEGFRRLAQIQSESVL